MAKKFITTIYEHDSGKTYAYESAGPLQCSFHVCASEDADSEEVITDSLDYLDFVKKLAKKYDLGLCLGGVDVRIPDSRRYGQSRWVQFGSDNSSPLSVEITCEEVK